MDHEVMEEAFAKNFSKDYLDMIDNKKDPLVSGYVYMAFANGFRYGEKNAIYNLVDKLDER